VEGLSKSNVREQSRDTTNRWIQAGLEVRVNPVLGPRINGCDTIIKLYFIDEALTKSRLAVVFELMREAFHPSLSSATLAIMDVANGRLI